MLLSTSASHSMTNVSSPINKDTTLTKIFVGGLPYHTTDESLRKYFEHYGQIEEAVVITDRNTGKSRGYGFVTMKRVEDASNAIRDPNPCIDGRKANVNLAILGAKPRNPPPGVTINNLARIQGLLPQLSVMPGLQHYYSTAPSLMPSTTLIGLGSNGHLTTASHAGSMATSPSAPTANIFDYTPILQAAMAGMSGYHQQTGTGLSTINYLGLPSTEQHLLSPLTANGTAASNAALLQYATAYNALQQQMNANSSSANGLASALGVARRENSLLDHFSHHNSQHQQHTQLPNGVANSANGLSVLLEQHPQSHLTLH